MKLVTFAAIQMDAAPQPTEARLARAEALVSQAAKSMAQVVVLPEVFNTGYAYTDENFRRAEPPDGLTARWMKSLSARLGVYLAGTLLLRDADGEIYNTMLLTAPDGQTWRYDKSYPWYWERAYFRPGRGPFVAETPLGRFGMLICWDMAHTDLWAAYAGKVQAVLSSSCPPLVPEMQLAFPDGRTLAGSQVSETFQWANRNVNDTFGRLAQRQAAWLGVPLVNTTGTGIFDTLAPRPGLTLSMFLLMAPRYWRSLAQLKQARMQARYFQETYVCSAAGQVLERVAAEQEGVAVGTVELADHPPQPKGDQPAFGLERMAYDMDRMLNWAMKPVYEKGKDVS